MVLKKTWEHPAVKLSLYLALFGSVFVLSFLICGCIPPVAGAGSGLSGVFAVALSASKATGAFELRVASFSVCGGTPSSLRCTTVSGKDRQTIASLISPDNATAIEITLLLEAGLTLQKKVFFGASVIAGLALVGGGISLTLYNSIAHYKRGNETSNSDMHLKRLTMATTLSTFIAVAVILADAYSAALVHSGLVTLSRFNVRPGKSWQALQWLAFSLALVFGVFVQFKFKDRAQAANDGGWDYKDGGQADDYYDNYNYNGRLSSLDSVGRPVATRTG